MATNLNFYPSFNNVSSFFHNSLSINQIQQRVSQIGRRIFRCLVQNQQAIAAGLGSYMCIQLGVVIAESLDINDIDHLESCQNIFCQQWDNSTRNQENSSSFLEFRCNPTHPNYHPFSFIEKCIEDLCQYMKANGQNLEGCSYVLPPSNMSLENEDLVLESKIWKALCPKIHLRHSNFKKKIKAINSCMQNLCNYYRVFSHGIPGDIMKFCESTNQDRINRLIKKLSKAVDKIENQLENYDFWTHTSSIASAVGGVLGVVSSLIAIGMSIFSYKAQIRNANIHPVVLNLRNILPGISEANTALRIENARNTVEESANIEALDNLLSEVQSLTIEMSQVFEHCLSYKEEGEGAVSNSGIEEGATFLEEVGVGSGIVEAVGSGVAGIVGALGPRVAGAGNPSLSAKVSTRVEIIRREGTELLKKLGGTILEATTIKEERTKDNIKTSRKIFKSVVVPGQTFHLPKDFKFSGIIQEYLNDFIFASYTDHNLTEIQAKRLNNTFEDWNGAFCTYNYPDVFFCRYPDNNDTTPGTLLPTHYTNPIVRHDLPGICYIILGDLWCNWNKIVKIFSTKIPEFVTPNYSDCPWDLFSLRVEEIQDTALLQVKALGHCYNQTAIF